MSNQRQFREVGAMPNNPKWEPKKQLPFVENNPYNTLHGYYVNETEIAGKDKPFKVHTLHLVDPNTGALGQLVDTLGDASLNNKLLGIELGSYVCLTFKGKKRKQSGAGDFNDWFVGLDDNVVPYAQMPGAQLGHRSIAPAPVFQQQVIPPQNMNFNNAAPVFNNPNQQLNQPIVQQQQFNPVQNQQVQQPFVQPVVQPQVVQKPFVPTPVQQPVVPQVQQQQFVPQVNNPVTGNNPFPEGDLPF